MRISFDLDDTLICYQPGLPREPRLPWYKRLIGGDEPLRLGARDLMRRLRERGWELYVYTTSHRPPRAVRRWLRCHGIQISRVINQDLHEAAMKQLSAERVPSKNPAAFGIDLHVDDSDGVRMEGDAHGFAVIVIEPQDSDWTQKIWLAADALMPIMSGERSLP